MLLTSTVIACSLLWAIIASVMAYNHGREIHTMAGRHNSVADQLSHLSVRLSNTRHELTLAQDTHLAALGKIQELQEMQAEMDDSIKAMLVKIDTLTAEKDQLTEEHRDKERELEKVYLTALEISNERLEEIEQWKGAYASAINMANRFERLHANMTTRHRDPKTGRIVKAPKPTASDEVRNLCDVVKANAVEDVNTESAMNMGRTMNIANSQVYRCKVTNIGFNHAKGHDVVDHDGAFEPCDLPADIDLRDLVDYSVVSGQYMYTTTRPHTRTVHRPHEG